MTAKRERDISPKGRASFKARNRSNLGEFDSRCCERVKKLDSVCNRKLVNRENNLKKKKKIFFFFEHTESIIRE